MKKIRHFGNFFYWVNFIDANGNHLVTLIPTNMTSLEVMLSDGKSLAPGRSSRYEVNMFITNSVTIWAIIEKSWAKIFLTKVAQIYDDFDTF